MAVKTLFRMVATYADGGKEFSVSITEMRKRGARRFKVTVEDLADGSVLSSPADNDRILGVMPVEFWPMFARESLLAGQSGQQEALFGDLPEMKG